MVSESAMIVLESEKIVSHSEMAVSDLKMSGSKRRYRRTIGTVDGCRTAGGRSSDGQRTVLGGARVVSGGEKNSFDRGGPIWPPRSNVTNDRLRGGSGGPLLPPGKNRCPPAKMFGKNEKKKKLFVFPVPSSRYLAFQPDRTSC